MGNMTTQMVLSGAGKAQQRGKPRRPAKFWMRIVWPEKNRMRRMQELAYVND